MLAISGCETHCKSELRRNQLKFSSLNIDFDGPSLDFLGSRKPAHEGMKKRYPHISLDEMAEDRLTVSEQELL